MEDFNPHDRCDACSEVRVRHAKIVAESANLLVAWANLLADKKREIKRLQEKSLCIGRRSWPREAILATTIKDLM